MDLRFQVAGSTCFVFNLRLQPPERSPICGAHLEADLALLSQIFEGCNVLD